MFSRGTRVLLDSDYQQIFKPFHYIQLFYCMLPFNIKQNYATPITIINFVLAGFVNILAMVLFYVTVSQVTFWGQSATKISFITYFQYVQCFMLLTFLNFYHHKTNFQLIMEIQELCRRIRNTEDTKRLKVMSWLWCGVVVMYYVFLVTLKLVRAKYWHWTRAIFLVITIIFEIKLTNIAMVLYFLLFKLRKWRKVLRNFIIEDETNKEVLDDLRVTFQKVISFFNLFKTTFQAIVLFHFVMTFFQCLIYIDIIILSAKTSPQNTDVTVNHVIGVLTWIIKGVIIESNLCIVCELFYSEVKQTRDEIIQKISSKLTGLEENCRNMELYRLGKCVRRVVENNFTKMTTCGMFTVDVALPLRMGSFVATYTLVLLQFAQ